jgi:hypothetical protein
MRSVDADCFAHDADIPFHARNTVDRVEQRVEPTDPLAQFGREASDITLQLGETFLGLGGGGRLIRTPLAPQNGQDS